MKRIASIIIASLVVLALDEAVHGGFVVHPVGAAFRSVGGRQRVGGGAEKNERERACASA